MNKTKLLGNLNNFLIPFYLSNQLSQTQQRKRQWQVICSFGQHVVLRKLAEKEVMGQVRGRMGQKFAN
jgi:hypothetical protein